ncbi:MAG: hypothetical protein J2P28_15785 [Actinobacteria bacterium]|nr:hypothetical protein [Actinomycetota bacterium]
MTGSAPRAYFNYSWDWSERQRHLEQPFPVSEYEPRLDVVRARMREAAVSAWKA